MGLEHNRNGFFHYSTTPLLHFPAASADQSPMPGERPVNEESAPDEVRLRHRTPITAVEAIVTVVAHREIAVRRHRVSLRRIGQISVPGRIAAIRRLGPH